MDELGTTRYVCIAARFFFQEILDGFNVVRSLPRFPLRAARLLPKNG